jgi:hypothetical protein
MGGPPKPNKHRQESIQQAKSEEQTRRANEERAQAAYQKQIQQSDRPNHGPNPNSNYGGPAMNYPSNAIVANGSAPLSSYVPHSYYAGSTQYGPPPMSALNLPTSTFCGYGYHPNGHRSDAGSSVSSRFTPPRSISGFDGPKDARPTTVNVGNLDLSLRMWYSTRGVSLPLGLISPAASVNVLMHPFLFWHIAS